MTRQRHSEAMNSLKWELREASGRLLEASEKALGGFLGAVGGPS